MNNSEYITIAAFAKEHAVPEEAVLNAIDAGKLKLFEYIDDQEVIHPDCLNGYKFDLIGVYDYAASKGVSTVAVYKRLDKKKILFTVEDNTMKIDWELYKDEIFRDPVFKFRGKNKPTA